MRKRCVQTYETKGLTQKLTRGGLRKTTKRVLAGVLAAAMVLTSGVVIPQNKTVAEAAAEPVVEEIVTTAWWQGKVSSPQTLNVGDTATFFVGSITGGVCAVELRSTSSGGWTATSTNNIWTYGKLLDDKLATVTGAANDDTLVLAPDTLYGITVQRTDATSYDIRFSDVTNNTTWHQFTVTNAVLNADDVPYVVAYPQGGTYLISSQSFDFVKKKITLKCVDGSGKELKTEEKQVYQYASYSIEPPAISGYLTTEPAITGTMGATDVTKTITYTSAAQHDLTVKYVNQAGVEVADKVVKQVDEGKPYTIKSPTVKGYAPNKTTLTGTMGNGDKTEEVVYKPVIATVGSDAFDTGWDAYNKFYAVTKKAGDFSVSFSFHNDSDGSANYKNFATAVSTTSGSTWYERADQFANSAFEATSADVVRKGGAPDWDTFRATLKDAEVGVSVVRSGSTITMSFNVVGANGVSFSWTSALENCPTDVVTVYLGCEAAKLSIYEATASDTFEKKKVTVHYVNAAGDKLADDVVEEVDGAAAYSIVSPAVEGLVADKKTVSGTMGDTDVEVTVTYKQAIATIGTKNAEGSYTLGYNDTANYYAITKTGDFTASYTFHNNSSGTDMWLNYAVIVRTGSGAEWYERADVYSNAPNWANTAFGNAITYSGAPDWKTFAATIKDAEVGVSVQRSGDQMMISHNVIGANGVSYSWSSTAACPLDDVTIYLGGEACMLEVYTASESDRIAVEGYTVKVSYVYEDGSKVADDVEQGPFAVGASYYIPSPEIEGYKADLPAVSGAIAREPVIKTVTYKPIKTEPIASVGKNEDGSYDLAFGDVDNYYKVPTSSDFELTFQFRVEGAPENNWETYAVVVRNAAGSEWYLRGDYYSYADGFTNTAFGKPVTYGGTIDWTTFLDTMKDANCTVQVTRSGSTMSISNVVEGANGVNFAWTATVKDCPTDDVSVWLGGEKAALTIYDASVKSDAPQPTTTPSEPTETPSEPTETPAQPTETPSEPTETPAQPTETPSKPAVENGDKVSNSNGTYKVTDASKKTVKYVDDKGNKKSVVVPSVVTIQGKKYKVTAVAKNAFKGNSKMKTVTIGKNITKIEAGAFKNCKNLKTIIINSTKLTSVAKDALKGTNAKLVIKVPAKKVAAYKKLFAGNKNVSVVAK